MIKHYSILLFFIFCTCSIFANSETLTIKLEENEKLVQTFSADWKQEQSVHLAIVKNQDSKSFKLKPYLLDSSRSFQELADVELEEEPRFESLHFSEELITLFISTKNGQEIIDIALDGSNSIKKDLGEFYEDYTLKLRQEGVTHLLKFDNETLHITSIENTKSIKDQERKASSRVSALLKDMFADNLQAIETLDFVDKGSISNSKAYVYDNRIYLTQDDVKSSSTNLIAIDLSSNDPISEVQVLNQNPFEKIKDYNSFLDPEKLVAVSLSKNQMSIGVSAINNADEEIKSYNQAQIANTKAIEDLDSFLNDASKSRNASTITTNLTANGERMLTVSYVNKSTYKYNWWLHHWMFHDQMIWQSNINTMMQSVPTGFGPAAPQNEFNYYKESDEIQLIINSSGFLKPVEHEKTRYSKIDKETYNESLKGVRHFRELSSAYLKDVYSYIYLDSQNNLLELRVSNYN